MRILPESWRDLARPFAVALAALAVFVVGAVVSNAFGRTGEFVVFAIVGLPTLALIGISYLWLWREFHAEADQRGWTGNKRRNEFLSFLLLGPLYLWLLRRESSQSPRP